MSTVNINKNKILILLATYNGEKFLESLINSILSQTFKNWILLIHDDGSTDHTLDIIYKYKDLYPNKIKLIEDNNIFKSAKANFAYLMQYAKEHFNDYQYIMFADQDDVWFPTKIEISLKKILDIEKKYGKDLPILVYTDLVVVDELLRVISCSFWKYQRINPKHNSFNRLLIQNVVTGCTILTNKPALDIATPVPKEAIMHDWWLALVVSAFGILDFIPTPTILYRQHPLNDTGAKKWDFYSAIKRIFNKKELETFKRNFEKSVTQAKIFYSLYKHQLSPKSEEILLSYINLPQKTFIEKFITIYKYRFLKSGFLRNLGYIIARLTFL